MADLSTVAQAYNNAGAEITAARATANFEQIVNTQGLSGRLLVCTIVKDAGDATEAELVAVLKALGNAGGSGNGSDTNGPDAFTVAAVSDFDGSDPVYVVLQGTGTPNTTPVTGFTLAIVATLGLAV
jgi:hypothetical protein